MCSIGGPDTLREGALYEDIYPTSYGLGHVHSSRRPDATNSIHQERHARRGDGDCCYHYCSNLLITCMRLSARHTRLGLYLVVLQF